jgi:hypothetical protein
MAKKHVQVLMVIRLLNISFNFSHSKMSHTIIVRNHNQSWKF